MRALLSWRRAAAVPWLAPAVVLVAIAGCAGQGPLPPQAGGDLFARAFDEIADLYIEPVSTQRLALSGMARLSRLDRNFGVSDSYANAIGGALTVSYEGRNIAYYAVPPDKDRHEWGELIGNVIASGRQVSPSLAALPQQVIEKTVFDGITAALDRFSRYATPEVARDQRAARDGFGGVGVTLDPADDLFRVTAVTPHGPADRAGIRPEDQIVSVDGVATSGCLHHDVVERLRGPVGSAVALKVLHPGGAQPRELRLNRAHVFEQSVTASRDGDIAVFRVNSFNHSTTRRMAEALAETQREAGERLAGIVLDLRGNPGGLLDQAVSLADLFIHDGPIAAAVGRHPASRQLFTASGNSVAPKVPMAVLINGGSASASESVAAALQDAGRAGVIGSASYGKGTVQTVLRLPNNGELILTWARLVAPSGYLLQRHGVVPTVCTSDLADDPNGLAVGLQRAVQASPGAAARPRAGLDEPGWAALRQSCPGRRSHPAIDLAIAKHLLAEPPLYAAAQHALPAAARMAQTAAADRPGLP